MAAPGECGERSQGCGEADEHGEGSQQYVGHLTQLPRLMCGEPSGAGAARWEDWPRSITRYTGNIRPGFRIRWGSQGALRRSCSHHRHVTGAVVTGAVQGRLVARASYRTDTQCFT